MIIARSPLRITLGGGGTDLPSYYREHGGFIVAAAIDKYVYITLHRTFINGLIVKYSKQETVSEVHELQHPLFRETLRYLEFTGTQHLEITSLADIPAGTGLGSSGSFTTALLKGLHTLKRNVVLPTELAEQACHIEIERLNEPVGKQDQYIAAIGGVTAFNFNKDDTVQVSPMPLPEEVLHNLEDNLMLFFTGFSRKASVILQEQDQKSRENDTEMINNLHYVKDLGLRSQNALLTNNLRTFGELMQEHWAFKKRRSGGMSNGQIDIWYDLAMNNGAIGGKLIGAGGGGFLMFYTEDKARLRHALVEAGLREVRFRFDFEGAKAVVQ